MFLECMILSHMDIYVLRNKFNKLGCNFFSQNYVKITCSKDINSTRLIEKNFIQPNLYCQAIIRIRNLETTCTLGSFCSLINIASVSLTSITKHSMSLNSLKSSKYV